MPKSSKTPVEHLIDGLQVMLLRHEGRADRLRIVRPDMPRTVARWTRAGLAEQIPPFELSWSRRKPWHTEDGVAWHYPTNITALISERLGWGDGVNYGAFPEALVHLRRSKSFAGMSVKLAWPERSLEVAVRPASPGVQPWARIDAPETLPRLARALRRNELAVIYPGV